MLAVCANNAKLKVPNILRAMQTETKVSVRYRRSARLSGVVVKRGLTVIIMIIESIKFMCNRNINKYTNSLLLWVKCKV